MKNYQTRLKKLERVTGSEGEKDYLIVFIKSFAPSPKNPREKEIRRLYGNYKEINIYEKGKNVNIDCLSEEGKEILKKEGSFRD